MTHKSCGTTSVNYLALGPQPLLSSDGLVRLVDDRVFGGVAADDATAFTGDTGGDIAGQRDSVHPGALGSVVGDGIMLGGPVVPDREVAQLPVPPDCVFRLGDSVLEKSIQ